MKASERFKLIPAVYLILRKEDKVLLSYRSNTGFMDNMYGLVAGHLDGGETAREGMVREAKEEVGINIDINRLKPVHFTHRIVPDREIVDIFFEVDRWEGEIVNLEPEKHDHVRFFSINNLPVNVIPFIRTALETYQRGVIYSEDGWDQCRSMVLSKKRA